MSSRQSDVAVDRISLGNPLLRISVDVWNSLAEDLKLFDFERILTE